MEVENQAMRQGKPGGARSLAHSAYPPQTSRELESGLWTYLLLVWTRCPLPSKLSAPYSGHSHVGVYEQAGVTLILLTNPLKFQQPDEQMTGTRQAGGTHGTRVATTPEVGNLGMGASGMPITATQPSSTCHVPATLLSALYATVSFYLPKECIIETITFPTSQTEKLRSRKVK